MTCLTSVAAIHEAFEDEKLGPERAKGISRPSGWILTSPMLAAHENL